MITDIVEAMDLETLWIWKTAIERRVRRSSEGKILQAVSHLEKVSA